MSKPGDRMAAAFAWAGVLLGLVTCLGTFGIAIAVLCDPGPGVWGAATLSASVSAALCGVGAWRSRGITRAVAALVLVVQLTFAGLMAWTVASSSSARLERCGVLPRVPSGALSSEAASVGWLPRTSRGSVHS